MIYGMTTRTKRTIKMEDNKIRNTTERVGIRYRQKSKGRMKRKRIIK